MSQGLWEHKLAPETKPSDDNSSSPPWATEMGNQREELRAAMGLGCEHTPSARRTLPPQLLRHRVSRLWAKLLHGSPPWTMLMLHRPPSDTQLGPKPCGSRKSSWSNSPRAKTKQGSVYPQPAAPKLSASPTTVFFSRSPFPRNQSSAGNRFPVALKSNYFKRDLCFFFLASLQMS